MTIPPPPEELRNELARLLASKVFSSSRRSRQLLEYFVSHLILGTAAQLKEYSVGIDVFGRAPSFDPKHETIVRNEVWRLRTKLANYYKTEGADNPLCISFRERSFEPVVMYRSDVPLRALSVARSPTTFELPRLAVLPFVSIGPGSETFNDGLTTDVIAQLSSMKSAQVVSRASSSQFKHHVGDIRDVADKLEAHMTLEGSVEQQGRTLRVVTLLTDASTNTHVYSKTYDQKASSSLRLELATTIAKDIDHALIERAGESTMGAGAGSRATYLDCLFRCIFRVKYLQGTVAGVANSIGYFQGAIESHPDSVSARRGLLLSLGTFFSLVPSSMSYVVPRFIATGAKAGEYGLGLLDARVGAGVAAMFNGEYACSGELLDSAVESAPDNSMVHAALGTFFLQVGRVEAAFQEIRIAQRMDPFSVFNSEMLALTLFNLRHFDDAGKQATRTLALDPQSMLSHLLLADTELLAGHHEAALSKLFTANRVSDAHPMILGKLGYAYALAGQRANAKGILHELFLKADDPSRIAPAIAWIYLGLGDMRMTLQWLKKAAEKNFIMDMMPRSTPFFDPLRSDPEFTALIPRLA